MDYILYTTEGFTQTEKGEDIDNCQILDFQYGTSQTQQQCIQNYLKSYPSKETGFNDYEIRTAITINKEVCNSIRELIEYTRKNIHEIKDKTIEAHINNLEKYFNL